MGSKIFLYGLSAVFIAAGLGDIIYHIRKFIVWMHAPKVEAVIVDVESSTVNNMVRYSYRFEYKGKICTVKGSWRESLNPLSSLFPTFRVGNQVTVRLDEKKMKVVSWDAASVVITAVGAAAAVLGVLMLLYFLSVL